MESTSHGHQDYGSLSDEQLVKMYQDSNDEQPVTELVRRYTPYMQRKAELSGRRSPSISVDDFLSVFMEALWKAARTFDVDRQLERGDTSKFQPYLHMKLTSAMYDKIKRDKDLTAAKRGIRTYGFLDLGDADNDHDGSDEISAASEERNVALVDETASYDHQISEAETDLFKRIQAKSLTDAQALLLAVRGMTYEEIATELGHDGNSAAKRNWTKRTMNRLRHQALEFLGETGDNTSMYELPGA